jgi:hypothetical protein
MLSYSLFITFFSAKEEKHFCAEIFRITENKRKSQNETRRGLGHCKRKRIEDKFAFDSITKKNKENGSEISI